MFEQFHMEGGEFLLYQKICREYERLQGEILCLQSEIDQLPKGNLIVAKNGTRYYKWYVVDENGKKFLPKKEHYTAEKLARKKYLLLQMKKLSKECKALEFYLKHHDERVKEEEQELLANPEFQKLVEGWYRPINQRQIEWMKDSFKCNTYHPENLKYRTRSGMRVRSKSELLIAMVLSKYGIAYRYECALWLGDRYIYPDFTILHPKTGEVFYWEHFGRMDDEAYSTKTFEKLQLYNSNGIIPTINLITTYETEAYPLDEARVENLVRFYFL